MSATELKLFIGMSRTLNVINRASDRIFTRYDLTRGQFAVLEALYHKGALSVGNVQELILTTSGNIPVIVRNLEKRGYLTRSQDSVDKRRFILQITPEGRSLMDQVFPQNEQCIKAYLNLFARSEQEQMVEWFKRFGEEKNVSKGRNYEKQNG